MSNAELLRAVLALPPDERQKIAIQALESLDPDDHGELCATQEQWDEAWAVEIEARLAQPEETIPADDLIRELRGRRGGVSR